MFFQGGGDEFGDHGTMNHETMNHGGDSPPQREEDEEEESEGEEESEARPALHTCVPLCLPLTQVPLPYERNSRGRIFNELTAGG